MSRFSLLSAMLYAVLAAAFLLIDLAIDHLVGNPAVLNTAHVILAVMVASLSFFMMSRALETRRKVESMLRMARDELEMRVLERTAELEHANALLQNEIEERRCTEEALRLSEEKFSTVFRYSPNAIGIARLSDQTIFDVNDAFVKIMGQTRSAIMGRTWQELNFFADVGEEGKIKEMLSTRGQVNDQEVSITLKDGSVSTLLLSLSPITISGEACLLAIAHDITERKQAEDALRKVQAELAQGLQVQSALVERQRLARELHDSVSQALYGISLGTHTAITLFDTDRTKVVEALNYVLSLAKAGLTEMRALIFELRPESLEMEGLVNALTKQTAALRARYGLEVNLTVCDEPDLPLKVKEAFYRIAQEAMQNAVKHAMPNRIDVRLYCSADSFGLEIQDDGIGFDPKADYPGHLGLRSMRERITNLGGMLEISSEMGRGTQIQAQIKLKSETNSPEETRSFA